MTYNINTYTGKLRKIVDTESFSRETTINIWSLKELSNSYGLPYIENTDSLTVVGEKQLLIFNKEHSFNTQEKVQCRLIEIY